MARILIVEDERKIQRGLMRGFQLAGHEVVAVDNGQAGYEQASTEAFDCVVLDLLLPGRHGLEVLADLRKEGKSVPVLLLTARDAVEDRVLGLDAGADDYLVKPFEMEELLARLKALQRRAAGWTQSVLHCGPVALDTGAQTVHLHDQALELTTFEYKVLEYLMLHAGQVVSKTELTDHLYEQDFERDSNVIEVFVGRLRRKLDPDNKLQPIETLRGRGYRLTLPRSAA